MRLTVKTPTGGSFSVQVESDKKPGAVLEILAAENGLLTDNLFLAHKGRVLTDDTTLDGWQVEHEDTLYVFKNPFPHLKIPHKELLSIRIDVYVQPKDADLKQVSVTLNDRVQTINREVFQESVKTLMLNGTVLNLEARFVECGINEGSIILEH